jgi:hypothetical protein
VALSYAQLEGLWIKAGGDPSVAPIAAAIVYPESGGNPSAVASMDPKGDGTYQSAFGLWQISNGTHTPPSPNWADPMTNAQLAVGKYKGAGNSFSPWGTYDTGKYRAYLQNGVAPDMTAGGGAGNGSPSNPTLASSSTPSLLDPSTWFTPVYTQIYNMGNYAFMMGVLLAGGLLVLVGLLLLVRGGDPVSTTTSVVQAGVGLIPGESMVAQRRRQDRERVRRNEQARLNRRAER